MRAKQKHASAIDSRAISPACRQALQSRLCGRISSIASSWRPPRSGERAKADTDTAYDAGQPDIVAAIRTADANAQICRKRRIKIVDALAAHAGNKTRTNPVWQRSCGQSMTETTSVRRVDGMGNFRAKRGRLVDGDTPLDTPDFGSVVGTRTRLKRSSADRRLFGPGRRSTPPTKVDVSPARLGQGGRLRPMRRRRKADRSPLPHWRAPVRTYGKS